jgi:hypothetical protein
MGILNPNEQLALSSVTSLPVRYTEHLVSVFFSFHIPLWCLFLFRSNMEDERRENCLVHESSRRAGTLEGISILITALDIRGSHSGR